MSRPYHKYVFDTDKRVFVGDFNEMYRQEEQQQFDSWDQENMLHLAKQISLVLINRYNFSSILDYGCGKGHFSSLLKKKNNKVTGIDISSVAIEKAKARFPSINFMVADQTKFLAEYKEKHDLIIAMEVLSYIENWKSLLNRFADLTSHLLLTLYIPENPIGFVKTFTELRMEVEKHFFIEDEIMLNQNQVIFMLKPVENETNRS
jgi:trans-aconitate methyltransferase